MNERMEKSISIIIPTYNESACLPTLLSQLNNLSVLGIDQEIIISDGTSTDNTINLASGFNVKIVTGQKGRSKQMNAGAASASGDVLYFLHVDSIPPPDFILQIFEARLRGVEAGCFRLRFDWDHWFLRVNAWFTRFNINAIRFGDQSLFVTRALFEKIGGFQEDYMLMEDQEIVNRIARHTKFRVLPDYITTSARKYRVNGAFRMQCIFFYIYFAYRFGTSQQILKNIHQKLIRTA